MTGVRFQLGPSPWVPGHRPLGLKQPERETNRPAQSSVELKNAWNFTCASPYVF
jgi:hypothetical protein